jgi:hypothetical protein
MMPAANSSPARSPASGRSACAACSAVSTRTPSWAPRHRGRHHDGEHHADPRAHAGGDVESHGRQVVTVDRVVALGLFLDLLTGLPEEQVGRDGGAEHRDQGRQAGAVEVQTRDDGVRQGVPPVHVDGGQDRNVGEQR